MGNAVTLMIKMVGSTCNMKCEYCYEKENNASNNMFSSSSDVINYLQNFINYENVFIVFHGGEPLLSKLIEIKICLDFIKNNFKNTYNIQFQTNGTLLSDEWIDLFKKYKPNLSISVSIDPIGNKDLRIINNSNIDYRDIVLKNIKKYVGEIENFGIVSVAHKHNIDFFKDFIEMLVSIGVKNLTINKYYSNNLNNNYISEKEYIDMIKYISVIWIRNRWYKLINIQPLNSLFSNKKNKICIYLPNVNKCYLFKTFYNSDNIKNFCDHIMTEYPCIYEKCLSCQIYDFCGGGCLMEEKNETFCNARKNLYHFINEIKNVN